MHTLRTGFVLGYDSVQVTLTLAMALTANDVVLQSALEFWLP